MFGYAFFWLKYKNAEKHDYLLKNVNQIIYNQLQITNIVIKRKVNFNYS